MVSDINNVFLHALEIWDKVNLPHLQQTLDDALIEIRQLESTALESRKNVAQETKKFKKLENDSKQTQVNKLIKWYQTEIDALTARSKYVEQKLLEVYGKISEAPDPKPLFQTSLDTLVNSSSYQDLEEENCKLKDQLAKFADYEILKERLLDLEQNSGRTLTKRLAAKEEEINSKWEEKFRNWEKKEAEMTKQLISLKDNNNDLESKLFNQKKVVEGAEGEQSSERSNPTFVEFQILVQELESCQLRILDLERRNEELSGNLAKATCDAEKESELYSKELKISHLESENILLNASLDRERTSLREITKCKNEEERLNEQKLAVYKSEIATIKSKLAAYSDYEQIKSELSALKKLEFGADDDGDSSQDNSVDYALISANKKLQNNVVELKEKNHHLESQNEYLNVHISKLQKKLKDLENLNSKLEVDLERLDDVETRFNDTTSMMSGVTRQITNRASKVSSNSSIFDIPEYGDQIGFSSTTPANSILPIVTHQRDRIRNKNIELERQVKQKTLSQTKLESEITQLKKDNQKLYERIRYLSSYSNFKKSRSVEPSMDVEAQYASNYEESLHPLADFCNSEREWYQSTMSPLQKIFMSLASKILSNNTTRMLFLFYCAGLHVLVMLMSIYLFNSSSSLSLTT